MKLVLISNAAGYWPHAERFPVQHYRDTDKSLVITKVSKARRQELLRRIVKLVTYKIETL